MLGLDWYGWSLLTSSASEQISNLHMQVCCTKAGAPTLALPPGGRQTHLQHLPGGCPPARWGVSSTDCDALQFQALVGGSACQSASSLGSSGPCKPWKPSESLASALPAQDGYNPQISRLQVKLCPFCKLLGNAVVSFHRVVFAGTGRCHKWWLITHWEGAICGPVTCWAQAQSLVTL